MSHKHKSQKQRSVVEKEQSQWVLICPDKIFEINPEPESNCTICKLRHPRTEEGSMFIISKEKNLYEILTFTEPYRSWLIDETVQQDGRLQMATVFDPLFIILPYLMKEQTRNKFMQLEQILEDEKFPECRQLCDFSLKLDHIADIKGDSDLKVHRYNEDKTLRWLKQKVEKVMTALEAKRTNVSLGSHAETFVKSLKSTESSKEHSLRYAHGLVCDCVPPNLSEALQSYLGIPKLEDIADGAQEPQLKRSKLEKHEPEEDYSHQNGGTKPEAKSKKQTVAQRKLGQVDKSGMKSMMSFFTAKSKK